MKFLPTVAAILVSSALPLVAATHRHPISSHRHTSKTLSKHTSAKPRTVGQRSIDDERATEIQQALIRAGYLSGEPSGHWDASSQAAMQKVQADNGWQTKLVPDSRALIKLGLGPHSDSIGSNESEETVVTPTALVSNPSVGFSKSESFATPATR